MIAGEYLQKTEIIKINNKNISVIVRRSALLCICMVMLGAVLLFPGLTARADGFDYNTWLTTEKAKYPNGKYWNHVGLSTDNSEGYTDTACSLHWTYGVDHIMGTGGCTCNHFADPNAGTTLLLSDSDSVGWHASSSQCMGFANKLGYDLFGSTMWSRITAKGDPNYKTNIRVGDLVRISGHTSFVIAKSADNKLTVAECNYTSKTESKCCVIAWGRVIDLNNSAITSGFQYYERAQNYDGIIAGTIAPVQTAADQTTGQTTDGTTEAKTTEATTEGKVTDENGELYTGWKLADDNEHYIYYKKGVKVVSKWLTLSKKKYYVDGNGYRVTGIHTISKNKYYFNNSGVMQKSKWVTTAGETYYIGSAGQALKSQWLYKGKIMVYVKDDCTMAHSELVKISGRTYYFNSKGKRSAGFKKCNKKYYYCNSYGIILKKQWITKGKKKYYVDKNGVRVQDKMIKIAGISYYFNKKGVLQKNKPITYDGKTYEADAYGKCKFIDYVSTEAEENE